MLLGVSQLEVRPKIVKNGALFKNKVIQIKIVCLR